jgi:cell wall-associated NlpC family hydrolase
MLSAAATAAVAVTVAPVAAQPAVDSAAASERVDRLLTEAERAVEAYNGTTERVEELRGEVERRQERLARSRLEVNRQRHQLGSAAAAHYRSGGIDPALALMLSQDPDGYLEQAAVLERVTIRQADGLSGLLSARRSLGQQRTEAGEALAELERQRTELAAGKERVQQKLAAARSALNRLTARERREREARDRAARDAERGEAGLAATSTLSATAATAAPSGRAAGALAAALQAVGRPYVWGQNGPGGFDCSGLTQWAYAQAGTSLPRTSQGQAHAGRRVGLDQARPGDLVIYRSDASHVAMYVGAGQVVHAPYPGSHVRYDPVGMMPVSAVVRP